MTGTVRSENRTDRAGTMIGRRSRCHAAKRAAFSGWPYLQLEAVWLAFTAVAVAYTPNVAASSGK